MIKFTLQLEGSRWRAIAFQFFDREIDIQDPHFVTRACVRAPSKRAIHLTKCRFIAILSVYKAT